VFSPAVFPMEPIFVGNIVIGQVYLWAFIASLVLLVAFVCFFKFTKWGLSMQATADDETAALSLGVNAKWSMLSPGPSPSWQPESGDAPGKHQRFNISVGYIGLLVLPAVVLGGLNSVPEPSWGIRHRRPSKSGRRLSEPLHAGGVKDVFPFAAMVIILLFKPYGLWGWTRIERV